MKKVITLFLCSILMLCVLTGCIHQDIGIKMNRDGTGSMTTSLGIEKGFYQQLKDSGSDPFDGKEVTEYKYDGNTYISCSEVKKYNSFDELEKALLELTLETEPIEDTQMIQGTDMDIETNQTETNPDADHESINGEGFGQTSEGSKSEQETRLFSSVHIEKSEGLFQSTYTFHAVLNAQSSEGTDYNLNDIFKVTLSVEMPAKITDVTGGTAEGNKVVFDITDITQSQEMHASCSDANISRIVGISLIVVIMIAGIVYLFKTKR